MVGGLTGGSGVTFQGVWSLLFEILDQDSKVFENKLNTNLKICSFVATAGSLSFFNGFAKYRPLKTENFDVEIIDFEKYYFCSTRRREIVFSSSIRG